VFKKSQSNAGGLWITGITDQDGYPVAIYSYQGAAATTTPNFYLRAEKWDSGTSTTSLTGTEIVLELLNSTTRLVHVNASGLVGINETVNTSMTAGITINQGTADDEILAFKSDDVAHGMTTQTETDTFGMIKRVSNDYGGLRITGFSETGTTMGAILRGVVTDEETDKTSSDYGAVLISGATRSAATFGNMSANANIVAIANNGTTVWIVDADGDTWQSGNITIEENTDSAATTDQVKIGAYELSAGNRALALSQEAAVAVEVDETKFSHKLPVRINGSTYYIMLTAT
jgi:hypothetical protein